MVSKSTQSFDAQQAFEQALALHRAGNLAQAETIYRQILSRSPHHAIAMHHLGLLGYQLGRYEDALKLIARSIELFPNQAGYYNNLGEVLRAMQRFAEAESAFRKAIALDPKNPQAYSNLGLAYTDQNLLPQALAIQETALRIAPNDYPALCNLGLVLIRLEQHAQAIPYLRRAIQVNPSGPAGWVNLAGALAGVGELEEALTLAQRGLELAPNDPQAHLTHTNVLLKSGQLAEGWPGYEWRLRVYPYLIREFPQPQWTGEDLAGKTILLHAEQGFGDAIQFVRYASLVAKRGAGRIILECQPEMTDLLASAPGVNEVVAVRQPLPEFDVHSSLLRLPEIFQTDLQTIPAEIPYLRADPQRIEHWKKRLESARLRVGLVWAGRPEHEKDRSRSCKLSDLAPLGEVKDVLFYSLQKGAGSEQSQNPPAGMRLIDHTNDLHNFSDSAALIEALDLVIAVDTAAVHLAGALAKPVWLMLAQAGEWRWLHNRDDSPWYPTMRLFRQPTQWDWASVAKRVAGELEVLSAKRV